MLCCYDRQAGSAGDVAVLGLYLARVEWSWILVRRNSLHCCRVGIGSSLAEVLRERELRRERLAAHHACLAVALNEEVDHRCWRERCSRWQLPRCRE